MWRWALALCLCGGCAERLIEGDEGIGGDDGGLSEGPPLDPQECDGNRDDDCDGDGIPDDDDPLPTDPDGPGPVRLDLIYLNSGDALMTYHPTSGTFDMVGQFALDDGGLVSVTDIAIDRFGLLYAVSLGTLYVCDPLTVVCTALGESAANSAGFAEYGAVDPDDDVLVVVEGADVVHMVLEGPTVRREQVATLEGYQSSGDVTDVGEGMMALSSPTSTGVDSVVLFDARTGEVFEDMSTGYTLVYGLAMYDGELWAFTDFGEVLRFDVNSQRFVLVEQVSLRLWGAATHPESIPPR